MSDYKGDALHVGAVVVLAEFVRHVIGLEMSVLIWAFCGGCFGTGFAPRTTLPWALLNYVCSSMLSGLVATGIEHALAWNDKVYTWIASAVIAMFFYPILAEVTKHVATILRGVLSRLGLIPTPRNGDTNDRS